MRDFPSCFGENGVQIADSSSSSSSTSKASNNLVTCVYQCQSRDRRFIVSVTWSKNLIGQGLSIEIGDSTNHSLCKFEIKPWLFSRRKGSKNLEVDSDKINVFWDLSIARFGSGPDPLEGFFLSVLLNQEMLLLLGDLKKEAYKKTGIPFIESSDSLYIARKEHIFGKKFYNSKIRLHGTSKTHDLMIECDTIDLRDPCLVIRIDGKPAMQIKRLRWKFRGNYTIVVEGVQLQVFWDVHNWLFGNGMGNAVFMFQTCLPTDEMWNRTPQSWSNPPHKLVDQQTQQGLGFSLVLHAWKTE